MIETMSAPAPNLWGTGPTPDPALLLAQLATLRQENAALGASAAAAEPALPLRRTRAALHAVRGKTRG
jgi:hypothetical protein